MVRNQLPAQVVKSDAKGQIKPWGGGGAEDHARKRVEPTKKKKKKKKKEEDERNTFARTPPRAKQNKKKGKGKKETPPAKVQTHEKVKGKENSAGEGENVKGARKTRKGEKNLYTVGWQEGERLGRNAERACVKPYISLGKRLGRGGGDSGEHIRGKYVRPQVYGASRETETRGERGVGGGVRGMKRATKESE